MPELPEVETIVRDLRPQLTGRRIESLRLTPDAAIRARLVRYPSATKFVRRLRGRTIKAVLRRGKYIVMPLEPAPTGTVAPKGRFGDQGIVPFGSAWPLPG